MFLRGGRGGKAKKAERMNKVFGTEGVRLEQPGKGAGRAGRTLGEGWAEAGRRLGDWEKAGRRLGEG